MLCFLAVFFFMRIDRQKFCFLWRYILPFFMSLSSSVIRHRIIYMGYRNISQTTLSTLCTRAHDYTWNQLQMVSIRLNACTNIKTRSFTFMHLNKFNYDQNLNTEMYVHSLRTKIFSSFGFNYVKIISSTFIDFRTKKRIQ